MIFRRFTSPFNVALLCTDTLLLPAPQQCLPLRRTDFLEYAHPFPTTRHGNTHPSPPGKNRRSAPICYFPQRDEVPCGSCLHKCGPTQQFNQGVCQCNRKSCVYISHLHARLASASDLPSWWGGMNSSLTTCGSNRVNLLRSLCKHSLLHPSPFTPNPGQLVLLRPHLPPT